MTTDIALETQAYQALLEGCRAHPEDRALADSLAKAKAALEAAWIHHSVDASATVVG